MAQSLAQDHRVLRSAEGLAVRRGRGESTRKRTEVGVRADVRVGRGARRASGERASTFETRGPLGFLPLAVEAKQGAGSMARRRRSQGESHGHCRRQARTLPTPTWPRNRLSPQPSDTISSGEFPTPPIEMSDSAYKGGDRKGRSGRDKRAGKPRRPLGSQVTRRSGFAGAMEISALPAA